MPSSRGARLFLLAVLAAASAALIALFIALLLWPLWVESRMPAARGVQPDRLPLGTVRAGAIVEASARVFVRAVDAAGVRAKVRAPRFVEVQDVHVGGRGEGEVVALGQSLWWSWIARQSTDAGNARLLRNLLEGKKRR